MTEGLNKRFVSFAKPFIEAAKNVFETMAHTKIIPGDPTIKKDSLSRGDYSSLLGISGEVKKEDGNTTEYKGMVVVSFPEETYLKVASAMLMETYSEYNDEIADVGNEIVNMIMGNTKRVLVDMGYTTSMAIPSSVSGKQHGLKYPGSTNIVLIPISSDHGEFFIEVAYQD